jgi:hypothetical protein
LLQDHQTIVVMKWNEFVLSPKCGTQLPDDAAFCLKCGASLAATQPKEAAAPTTPILAPLEAKSLKCPSCGAPITPKFGEMIITCEYCGTGVRLGNDGWRGVQRQTMLPLKSAEKDHVVAGIHGLMDRGLLHRHVQESSTLEEMNLSFVRTGLFPSRQGHQLWRVTWRLRLEKSLRRLLSRA